MKLSDAILLGSMQYKQAFGAFVDEHGHRCVMGGAFGVCNVRLSAELDGRRFLMWPDRPDFPKQWQWVFEDIRTTKRCHECGLDSRIAATIIVHLNDEHKWPAAKIAQWVATVEPPVEETQDLGRDPAESTSCELVLSK